MQPNTINLLDGRHTAVLAFLGADLGGVIVAHGATAGEAAATLREAVRDTSWLTEPVATLSSATATWWGEPGFRGSITSFPGAYDMRFEPAQPSVRDGLPRCAAAISTLASRLVSDPRYAATFAAGDLKAAVTVLGPGVRVNRDALMALTWLAAYDRQPRAVAETFGATSGPRVVATYATRPVERVEDALRERHATGAIASLTWSIDGAMTTAIGELHAHHPLAALAVVRLAIALDRKLTAPAGERVAGFDWTAPGLDAVGWFAAVDDTDPVEPRELAHTLQETFTFTRGCFAALAPRVLDGSHRPSEEMLVTGGGVTLELSVDVPVDDPADLVPVAVSPADEHMLNLLFFDRPFPQQSKAFTSSAVAPAVTVVLSWRNDDCAGALRATGDDRADALTNLSAALRTAPLVDASSGAVTASGDDTGLVVPRSDSREVRLTWTSASVDALIDEAYGVRDLAHRVKTLRDAAPAVASLTQVPQLPVEGGQEVTELFVADFGPKLQLRIRPAA